MQKRKRNTENSSMYEMRGKRKTENRVVGRTKQISLSVLSCSVCSVCIVSPSCRLLAGDGEGAERHPLGAKATDVENSCLSARLFVRRALLFRGERTKRQKKHQIETLLEQILMPTKKRKKKQ